MSGPVCGLATVCAVGQPRRDVRGSGAPSAREMPRAAARTTGT
jgi:hypothetical protein